MSEQLDKSIAKKHNSSTGFDWCRKREAKKRNIGRTQTSGAQKGWNCQASPLERFMAKHNRSYKHKGYSTWCRSHNGTGTKAKF